MIIILRDQLSFNWKFLLLLIPVGLSAGIAQILYMHALKKGKLSKTVPLLTLSPIFTIPFAFWIIKELPSLIGIIGIFLIVIGGYILNIENISKNIFAPFKQIYANPGSRFMLMVAVIYGFGIVLDKLSVMNSNPITYVLFQIYSITLVQGTILCIKDKKKFTKNAKQVFKTKLFWVILIGVITTTMLFFQQSAIKLTFAAYVSAIKRTAAVFSVIAGFFIFKERKHFLTTLIGAIVMVIGTFLLVI